MESGTSDKDEWAKNFAEMPEWFQKVETIYKPAMENNLNELMAEYKQLNEAVVDEHAVRDQGIELAIQRYGLRTPEEDEESTEEQRDEVELNPPETKRQRTEEDTDDIFNEAIMSAIAGRGLAVQMR